METNKITRAGNDLQYMLLFNKYEKYTLFEFIECSNKSSPCVTLKDQVNVFPCVV